MRTIEVNATKASSDASASDEAMLSFLFWVQLIHVFLVRCLIAEGRLEPTITVRFLLVRTEIQTILSDSLKDLQEVSVYLQHLLQFHS